MSLGGRGVVLPDPDSDPFTGFFLNTNFFFTGGGGTGVGLGISGDGGKKSSSELVSHLAPLSVAGTFDNSSGISI
jgi:hypothetical protein